MAAVVMPGFTNADMHIEGMTVDHDMHEGRLRGGQSTVLRIRTSEGCVVHMGDIGERLTSSQTEWLRQFTPDLLIVPAGGWYTLDAGGALELIRLIRPATAWACHTWDDGVKLSAMDRRQTLLRLWKGPSPETLHEWTPNRAASDEATRLVVGAATP